MSAGYISFKDRGKPSLLVTKVGCGEEISYWLEPSLQPDDPLFNRQLQDTFNQIKSVDISDKD